MQLQKLVRDKKAMAQVKQYTEQFRKELKEHLSDDIARMRVFLDRARDEVKALQNQYLRRPRRPKKARTKKGDV
jgi:tRNA uridine 5-carbamoylmethylation protein Kti12